VHRTNDDAWTRWRLGECVAQSVARRRLGQSEVREFGVSISRHEDVGRLDVSMKNVRGVRGRESVGHTRHQVHGLSPRWALGVSPVLQGATVRELGDEELAALELASVVDGENVRMIERGGHPRLTLEALARGRIGDRLEQKLY